MFVVWCVALCTDNSEDSGPSMVDKMKLSKVVLCCVVLCHVKKGSSVADKMKLSRLVLCHKRPPQQNEIKQHKTTQNTFQTFNTLVAKFGRIY